MVRFHEAIGIAVSELEKRFADAPPKTVIVRDPIGALSVVVPDDSLDQATFLSLRDALHAALGAYSRGERAVLVRHTDLVDAEDILASQDLVPLPGSPYISLLDRLQTNQEWLRSPIEGLPKIKVAAAFSIKGGVGRSTAIAVLAWYLARRGKNVLVVDLDLEAPGIASLLLSELPKLGLIDWLAESLVDQAGAGMLDDMISVAPISDFSDGRVRVLPAFGDMSEDYVAKLGRAYLPVVTRGGEAQGFGHRIASLLQEIAGSIEPPDIVLLDARAGMHDIGAAAVTQLDADVLLFARDDQQTWAAYDRLFAHLRQSRAISWGMPENDLRWRLKMVAAQLDTEVAPLV